MNRHGFRSLNAFFLADHNPFWNVDFQDHVLVVDIEYSHYDFVVGAWSRLRSLATVDSMASKELKEPEAARPCLACWLQNCRDQREIRLGIEAPEEVPVRQVEERPLAA